MPSTPFASRLTTLDGLVQADALAQRYGVRPSALWGASDEYTAYCVDEACALAALLGARPPAGEAAAARPTRHREPTLEVTPAGARFSGKIPVIRKQQPKE